MKTAMPQPADTDRLIAERYVFLIDLADYLGRTTTAIHTRVQRLKITPVRVRRAESGKAALAVTASEARRLIEIDTKPAVTITPSELMKEK